MSLFLKGARLQPRRNKPRFAVQLNRLLKGFFRRRAQGFQTPWEYAVLALERSPKKISEKNHSRDSANRREQGPLGP
jgi:hypothetical protein